MPQPPPDIVFLAPEWQPRALIRAQLIEEGFEVVAMRSWPMMRRHLRPGSKPRLAIVDLKGLSDPQSVLRDLGILMKPDRVLVISASGTIAASEIKRLGYRVVRRPFLIEDLVRTVRNAISEGSG
jgi:DNA-binding NtrC family response regulator